MLDSTEMKLRLQWISYFDNTIRMTKESTEERKKKKTPVENYGHWLEQSGGTKSRKSPESLFMNQVRKNALCEAVADDSGLE